MCEQTENNYLDGDVVWVKLGSCWWPGEVVGSEKLPPDVLPSFRKPPIAVVKFFQEDTYEYVKNTNAIYRYNCDRKNEFINKGLYMYRTKHGPMEKFPEDVIRAETAVGGDIEILTRDEFQEVKKESYAGLFGDSAKKMSGSGKKGRGRRQSSESSTTPVRKMREKTNYKVHILVQGSNAPSSQPEILSTPSTSGIESELAEDKLQDVEKSPAVTVVATPSTLPSTPTSSNSGHYSCHACSFSTTRLNVLILHNKTHSVTYTPYTPSPVRKKPVKPIIKSTSSASKIPKVRRPRKEKSEIASKKANKGQKRSSENDKSNAKEVKKPKTDEEIKSSLLADWDDVDDDESNDDSSVMAMAGSPEIAVAAESPAVPTPAELPSAQVPGEPSLPTIKKITESPAHDKAESSSDSKYEFCEDEDWPLEADGGRKIPRVKNPSKRKDDTKSLSIDEDEVAREVAELLNKTTVPELPSVPEPLKVEENFPEPSIIKSPDKKSEILPEPNISPETAAAEIKPTKAIFKTKTFFRSRHSRSQDVIGKYVAEQLNAVERMDMSESEINGSDTVSSPEARDSPPIEPVKVARLAPKIQLKKMKAEAAQLREKEKGNRELCDYRNKEREFTEDASLLNVAVSSNTNSELNSEEHTSISIYPGSSSTNTISHINTEDPLIPERQVTEINDNGLLPKSIQDVLYPTQEIKPVCEEVAVDKCLAYTEENNKENVNDVTSESTKNTDNETCIDTYPETCIDTCNETETEIETNNLEMTTSDITFPNTNLQKSDEQAIEPYMNESTASAVDALLSVSRDADRVTRIISDDPPEDLFEDDNKDNVMNNSINGFEENVNENNIIIEKMDVGLHDSDLVEESKDLKIDFHEVENSFIGDVNPETDHQIDEKINEVEVCDEIESNTNEMEVESVIENVPSESDLQIAETLINLPSTAIQSKTSDHQEIFNLPVVELPVEQSTEEIVEIPQETSPIPQIYDAKEEIEVSNVEPEPEPISDDKDNINVRFETELEKSENLNAAQSLVQMSESIDHKMNVVESKIVKNKELSKCSTFATSQKNGIDATIEQKVSLLSSDNNSEPTISKVSKFDTSSSKLLKILEEPTVPKVAIPKVTSAKQIIIPGKEKILNFDVAKSFIGKPQSPVIIRRTTASKTLINNISEITTPDKIILSRNNKSNQDGSSVQTYTMQTTPEPPSNANTITIIQQKIRKVPKTQAKLQKIKQVNSLASATPLEPKILNETTATDDAMFDINSMPIVLSDDLLTPENIEKMPIVMSDGNIITNTSNPPKLVKTKSTVSESEKISVTTGPSKSDVKTLVVNPVSESVKITTPNILSKSSKLRGAKPMLVIDKTTGNKKIIVTKGEPPIKEIKQTPTLLQQVTQNTGKAEKFIILPSASSPRPGRTQKIVIDPQTGKAHVLVAKGPETSTISIPDNKPVSAKLISSSSNASVPGNTVMIITNAQGAQSKIVLTPEHEKILFPNKQPPNMSQLKTITQRISPNPVNVQKTVLTTVAPVKTQTRIVPKQKNAIITSKGQLIVGARASTTTQNIAALPEIRPSPKRIIAAEPKKIIQTVKNPSDPLIFLQQKSGAVVQLTASQFEHFKRTGQIIQKTPGITHENKILVQKSKPISGNESVGNVQKQRIRRTAVESPTPAKKMKHEIAIAPALPPAPVPALTPLSHTTATSLIQPAVTAAVATSSTYPELENFEELLPSTAISRQVEQPTIQVEPAPLAIVPAPPAIAQAPPPLLPAPAPLSDGQLLAVPGEHFGGPPGSFYLCVEDNRTLTPIDNRPLVLENNQLVPMTVDLPILTAQPERRDILEAALANSDVFHADTPRDEAPDFRDLNANVSVHCRVSETSTTLNQPIMTPVEVPTKGDSEPTVPSNLEDGLAVIGVTPHTVPTSLELPITVTDPRIAPKTTDPLSGNNYGTSLLPSPNTEMTFVSSEEVEMPAVGPISMPLLTDEEAVGGGKSMPILTDADEVAVSSVESADSLSSAEVEVRSEPEEHAWARRLLTPGSDTSEASAEIPLQPPIQLSVNDLSRHS